MFRVVAWIERIQTETLFKVDVPTLDRARAYILEDFESRKRDKEFLEHGGYAIEEQIWKTVEHPAIYREPTVRFN
jgi:hypothetical protein